MDGSERFVAEGFLRGFWAFTHAGGSNEFACCFAAANVAFRPLRMPVWPKIVYTFKVSLRTAATRRKLRQPHRAPAQQEQARTSLTARLAATSFWKAAGLESGMSYSRFQERVPLHTYDQIAPAVEQMKRGETDVLWPGRCTLFGLTAGTNGQPRCLPMTDALLAHFRHAGLDALLYYNARARHAGIFHGRHLFLGGNSTLTPLAGVGPPAAFIGDVSGIAGLHLPKWVEAHFHEPGLAVAQMPSWDAQLDAIADRTRSRDITLIAGVPDGVTLLAQALRKKFSKRKSDAPLQDRWPNLECYAHTGAPITPYAAELRCMLGPGVAFHDIYAASECFVAAQDEDAAAGLRVMADRGVFFEFVPLSDFDDLRLALLGPKAVPLSGVKAGVDYVILVTTPGGLARYLLEDVVRFTSVEPPRLVYVGGTRLRLNALDENVSEKEVSDALAALCQRRAWTLVNFHVAPLLASSSLTGQKRGSHEWWVELKPGTVATPTGPQMALELDADLQRANSTYAAKRTSGVLDSPTVRLVMPGVFEHWLRYHGKWGGQHKMPRCRSDRLVADEFAHVTHFAPD